MNNNHDNPCARNPFLSGLVWRGTAGCMLASASMVFFLLASTSPAGDTTHKGDLHVEGSLLVTDGSVGIRGHLWLRPTNAPNNKTLIIGHLNEGTPFIDGAIANQTLRIGDDSPALSKVHFNMNGNTPDAYAFNIEGSPALFIHTSRRVGIGTTSPKATLDARGTAIFGDAMTPAAGLTNIVNIMAGANAEGSQNGISFYDGTTSASMSLGYDGTRSGSKNALRMYDGNNNPRFTFESGGEMGVGTTDPRRPLHVYRSSGNAYIRIEGGTNSKPARRAILELISSDGRGLGTIMSPGQGNPSWFAGKPYNGTGVHRWAFNEQTRICSEFQIVHIHRWACRCQYHESLGGIRRERRCLGARCPAGAPSGQHRHGRVHGRYRATDPLMLNHGERDVFT